MHTSDKGHPHGDMDNESKGLVGSTTSKVVNNVNGGLRGSATEKQQQLVQKIKG